MLHIQCIRFRSPQSKRHQHIQCIRRLRSPQSKRHQYDCHAFNNWLLRIQCIRLSNLNKQFYSQNSRQVLIEGVRSCTEIWLTKCLQVKHVSKRTKESGRSMTLERQSYWLNILHFFSCYLGIRMVPINFSFCKSNVMNMRHSICDRKVGCSVMWGLSALVFSLYRDQGRTYCGLLAFVGLVCLLCCVLSSCLCGP